MVFNPFQPIPGPNGTAHRRRRVSSPDRDNQGSRKRFDTGSGKPAHQESSLARTASLYNKQRNEPCSFQHLPAELLAQIFGYVLTKYEPLRFAVNYPKKMKERNLGFDMLHVNKLFLEHAGAVAYGTNSFQVTGKLGMNVLRTFLSTIGQMRGLVKHFDWSTLVMDWNNRTQTAKAQVALYLETDLKLLASITVSHDDICGSLIEDDWTNLHDAVKVGEESYVPLQFDGTLGFLRDIYHATRLAKQEKGRIELFRVCEGGDQSSRDTSDRFCCVHSKEETERCCGVTQQHCDELALELNSFCAKRRTYLYIQTWDSWTELFPMLTQADKRKKK